MPKKDLRNATLTIRDATTPTPLSTVVKIGTGNITFTENYPMEYETDRGSIANGTVRRGDDVPVEVNVTCTWFEILSEATDLPLVYTPKELLRGEGRAVAAISVGADPCEPYACELELLLEVECATGARKDEKIVFDEFRVESCAFDVSAGTLVFSGKSKQISPSVTRPAQA